MRHKTQTHTSQMWKLNSTISTYCFCHVYLLSHTAHTRAHTVARKLARYQWFFPADNFSDRKVDLDACDVYTVQSKLRPHSWANDSSLVPHRMRLDFSRGQRVSDWNENRSSINKVLVESRICGKFNRTYVFIFCRLCGVWLVRYTAVPLRRATSSFCGIYNYQPI